MQTTKILATLALLTWPGCDSGSRECTSTLCPATYCTADMSCLETGCTCSDDSYCSYETRRCEDLVPTGSPCEGDISCVTGVCSRLEPRLCIEPGDLDAPCARHDECASDNCSLIQDILAEPQVAGRCLPPAGTPCDPEGDDCSICLPTGSGGVCAQLCRAQWGAFCDAGYLCYGRTDTDTYWCNRLCTDFIDDRPRAAPSRCPEGFRCYDRYTNERNDETFYGRERYVCYPDAFFM